MFDQCTLISEVHLMHSQFDCPTHCSTKTLKKQQGRLSSSDVIQLVH